MPPVRRALDNVAQLMPRRYSKQDLLSLEQGGFGRHHAICRRFVQPGFVPPVHDPPTYQPGGRASSGVDCNRPRIDRWLSYQRGGRGARGDEERPAVHLPADQEEPRVSAPLWVFAERRTGYDGIRNSMR